MQIMQMLYSLIVFNAYLLLIIIYTFEIFWLVFGSGIKLIQLVFYLYALFIKLCFSVLQVKV